MIRYTLGKHERLTRRKLIADVHERGTSLRSPAMVLVYLRSDLPEPVPAQVLFAVSKRNYRRAHDRNRIKRLMREAYRKQKPDLFHRLSEAKVQYALMFIFTGRQLPNQAYVHGKMKDLLRQFNDKKTTDAPT